jgi:hypothetical protein
MNKSPEIKKMLDAYTMAAYGRVAKEGDCVICGATVNIETDFRDTLSKMEYDISSMCQACQDKIFGVLPITNLEEENDLR